MFLREVEGISGSCSLAEGCLVHGEAVSTGLEYTVTSSQEDLVTFLVKEMPQGYVGEDRGQVCSRGDAWSVHMIPEWGFLSQEPLSFWSGRCCPLSAPGDHSAALCDGRCCWRPHRGVPRVRVGPVRWKRSVLMYLESGSQPWLWARLRLTESSPIWVRPDSSVFLQYVSMWLGQEVWIRGWECLSRTGVVITNNVFTG